MGRRRLFRINFELFFKSALKDYAKEEFFCDWREENDADEENNKNDGKRGRTIRANEKTRELMLLGNFLWSEFIL